MTDRPTRAADVDHPPDAAGPSRPAATSGAAARWSSPSGDHEWRASAEGNGAIDALYRAVDKALAEILSGHPRLLAYDIHALGEGTDTIGVVTVRIAPPDVGGERGSGEYRGEARGPNIIAASIEAYIMALNAMLAEAHWEGAPEAAAAHRDASPKPVAGVGRRGARPARRARRGRPARSTRPTGSTSSGRGAAGGRPARLGDDDRPARRLCR